MESVKLVGLWCVSFMNPASVVAGVWREKGEFHLLGSTKQVPPEETPWPLVYKRTIPTVRPPLVDEI
jgi:hypothetical protein